MNQPVQNKNGQLIEKTIIFLVTEYQKTGHNSKPVILHCLRIGFRLLDKKYSATILAGAILHDLIEDSNVTYDKIASVFGKKIANLVYANTFDASISNPEKRYKELFARTCKAGRDALIIKAADLYDNSFYYHLAKKSEQKMLLEKLKYFLKISKPMIGKDSVWKDLQKRLNEKEK